MEEFAGLMLPGSHTKMHSSTFNKLEADLWKIEALLALLFMHHAGVKMQRRVSGAASRVSWFNIVWTLFMKPSRKWPFFFSPSAAWRKRSIPPHIRLGFISFSSGAAHADSPVNYSSWTPVKCGVVKHKQPRSVSFLIFRLRWDA